MGLRPPFCPFFKRDPFLDWALPLAGSPIKTKRRRGKIDLVGRIRGSSPFGEVVACVASVFVRFRSNEEPESKTERKMALVPFLVRPKPKITLLGLSLLQNPKATCLVSDVIAQSGVLQQSLGSFSSGFSFNAFLGGEVW